jgi:hypothetical protein
VKLASGRGHYYGGKRNFRRVQAVEAYRYLLSTTDFFAEESILCAAATRSYSLYGSERLEAAMHALFQRMRRMCEANKTAAMVFFDQGHPEYRKLYRRSQVYLPTGSLLGGWNSGPTRNIPLDMFFEDGNEKDSKHCNFTQLADLVAYAAFLKAKGEVGALSDWQRETNAQTLYDALPVRFVDRKASYKSPQDGIVRL